eukprot:scaffold7359_cov255-Pinguiococcus_pyrenoidosus.AAC.4
MRASACECVRVRVRASARASACECCTQEFRWLLWDEMQDLRAIRLRKSHVSTCVTFRIDAYQLIRLFRPTRRCPSALGGPQLSIHSRNPSRKAAMALAKEPLAQAEGLSSPKSESAVSKPMALSIALYSLASSSMLLVNKALVQHVASHGLVVAVQLLFTSITVYLATTTPCKFDLQGRYSSGLEPVVWSWNVVKLYLIYTGLFVSGVYANMRALAGTNVGERRRLPPLPSAGASCNSTCSDGDACAL